MRPEVEVCETAGKERALDPGIWEMGIRVTGEGREREDGSMRIESSSSSEVDVSIMADAASSAEEEEVVVGRGRRLASYRGRRSKSMSSSSPSVGVGPAADGRGCVERRVDLLFPFLLFVDDKTDLVCFKLALRDLASVADAGRKSSMAVRVVGGGTKGSR